MVLTVAAQLLTKNLAGKVMVVTGANTGVGFETVKQLARQNATIVMCARSEQRGQAALESIKSMSDLGSETKVELMLLDVSKMSSVRKFAEEFSQKFERLDVLVHNAGVMYVPYEITDDGFELHMATNYFGPFLLTHLLFPKLKATPGSRVLVTASAVHAKNLMGPAGSIIIDDLNWKTRTYDENAAYNQSKLADIMLAREMAKMIKQEGSDVSIVSLHPGWVQSELIRHKASPFLQSTVIRFLAWVTGNEMLTTEQGAFATLHCILDDDVPNHRGEYYSQSGPYADNECKPGGFPMKSPNPLVYDDDLNAKLYKVSCELVGCEPLVSLE